MTSFFFFGGPDHGLGTFPQKNNAYDRPGANGDGMGDNKLGGFGKTHAPSNANFRHILNAILTLIVSEN